MPRRSLAALLIAHALRHLLAQFDPHRSPHRAISASVRLPGLLMREPGYPE
jgi:hypothetical protein